MEDTIQILVVDKNDKIWKTNLIRTGFYDEYSIILVSDSYNYSITLILNGEPSFFKLTKMVNNEVECREKIEEQEKIKKWIEDVEYALEDFLDEISSKYIFEEELNIENMKKMKIKVNDIIDCGGDLLYYIEKILGDQYDKSKRCNENRRQL